MMQIRRVFWGGFAIAILSFFTPFLEDQIGIDVYKDILKLLKSGPIDAEILFVCFLLSCIIVWLPLMASSFHRYTLEKRHYTFRQRIVNYFLFSVGFSAYALPIYLYYHDSLIFSLISWGYWLLMFCMTIMFICYLIMQKKQLMEEDEISQHLVNNN